MCVGPTHICCVHGCVQQLNRWPVCAECVTARPMAVALDVYVWTSMCLCGCVSSELMVCCMVMDVCAVCVCVLDDVSTPCDVTLH